MTPGTDIDIDIYTDGDDDAPEEQGAAPVEELQRASVPADTWPPDDDTDGDEDPGDLFPPLDPGEDEESRQRMLDALLQEVEPEDLFPLYYSEVRERIDDEDPGPFFELPKGVRLLDPQDPTEAGVIASCEEHGIDWTSILVFGEPRERPSSPVRAELRPRRKRQGWRYRLGYTAAMSALVGIALSGLIAVAFGLYLLIVGQM